MPDEVTAKAGRPGRYSLGCGAVAVIFLLIPVVGDVVTPVTGISAVVLGLIGLGRVERGTAVNTVQALTGIAFGAVAILFWLIFFAVAI